MANEKRLISVEKTVKELEGEIYWTDSTKVAIRAFLRTVPAVDAVEVVRCKDCKWSEQGEWYSAGLLCTNPKCHKYIPHYEVPQTHFCSYGERKDNG